MVRSFRALLDFVGRATEAKPLRRKKFGQYKPPYLEISQVYELADEIPGDWEKRYPLMGELIKMTFNLGGRISEMLAIEKTDVCKSDGEVIVKIQKQWVRKDHADANSPRLRETKNKSVRNVVPINLDETLQCLTKWLKAYPKMEQRERYRYGIDRYIRKMCRLKFGIKSRNDKVDDTSFFDIENLPEADADRKYRATHMLRAGHAVYMMAMTGNEHFVANQLGDTPEVVREHYAGRTNKASTIAEVIKILKRK